MKPWRWIALALTIAGIAFNYFAASGDIMSRITDRYGSLFVPAGYAFTIWSLIYLSVIIYLAFTLSAGQREERSHDGLAKLLSILAILGMVWITAYTGFNLGQSVIFILLMLGVSLLSLKTAHIAITERRQRQWIIIPFSLYSAWLSVASIANISLYLNKQGWLEGTFSESTWAIIMLITATILGMVTAVRYKTIYFPAVIAWATTAIWIKQRDVAPGVGGTALAASIVLLVFIVAVSLKIYSRYFNAPKTR